jgi:hypothetical protein
MHGKFSLQSDVLPLDLTMRKWIWPVIKKIMLQMFFTPGVVFDFLKH